MTTKKMIVLLFVSSLITFSSCGLFDSGPDNEGNDDFITYEEILFKRSTPSESQICAIRPDGSDFRIICSFNIAESTPTNPLIYVTAKWSPDKRYIALIGGPESTLEYYPIWLLSSSGGFLRKLTWNAIDVIWYDNETIYFTRAKGYFSLQYDLYKMNINDMNETVAYSQTDSTNINFGDFFNASEWIAVEEIYSYDEDGKQILEYGDIMRFDINTLDQEYLVVNPEGIEWDPLLSPQKDKVVYSTHLMDPRSWSPRNLYWFNMEDMNPHQLTFFTGFNPYQNAPYVWSPEGDQIAVSNPNPMVEGQQLDYTPYSDIFTINLQSGQVDTLTHTAQDSVRNSVVDWR